MDTNLDLFSVDKVGFDLTHVVSNIIYLVEIPVLELASKNFFKSNPDAVS